jgi:hypothetical protein
VTALHYGDLRARATIWWALQRARIRLELAAGAAKKAGWGTPEDPLSLSLKALRSQERSARLAAVAAFAQVYPAIAAFVDRQAGLGDAVALFCGLIPPLHRLEEFPGFPCPTALWTYCGMIAQKREKFDRRARMIAIAYLATPALLQSESYHALYTARREATASRGWTKMHAHRDGIRYVAKRILRELWRRRLPVGSPEESLVPTNQFTAAGVAPSVDLPTDTRVARENPHGGAAPVPEAAPPSMNGFAPTTVLPTPESAAFPYLSLQPEQGIAAPEPDFPPVISVPSETSVSAPESA